jgi:hypothetical protein
MAPPRVLLVVYTYRSVLIMSVVEQFVSYVAYFELSNVMA